MTGEITILGKVLPVEGIHEKIVAAADAGIRTVYIPAGNEKDIQMLPPDVRQKLDIRLASRVEDVLNSAIVGYRSPIGKEQELPEVFEKEPHIALDELENALRDCIKSNLQQLSDKWWVERVPPDVQQKAEERRSKEEVKRDPVQYLDFPDYLKIITRRDNWRETFGSIFKDESILAAKLKELEPIRNAVRHTRKLTSEQKEKLKIFARDKSRHS